MKKLIVLALATLGCLSVHAADRPILSCDKAPLLPYYQKQLPDHVLGAIADRPPHLTSQAPMFYGGDLFKRAGTTLVCFVVALDAAGKPEAAEISYPRGVKLTAKERKVIMATTWIPALVQGQARSSLVSIDFSYVIH